MGVEEVPPPVPGYHDLMNTPEKLTRIFREAGFSTPNAEVVEISHPLDRADFLRLRAAMGPDIARVESLDEEQAAEYRRRAAAACSGLAPEAFCLRSRVIRCSGER